MASPVGMSSVTLGAAHLCSPRRWLEMLAVRADAETLGVRAADAYLVDQSLHSGDCPPAGGNAEVELIVVPNQRDVQSQAVKDG